MAQTESKIRLIFDGVERGVVAAAAKSSAAIRSLDDDNSKLSRSADKAGAALGVMTKGMAVMAAVLDLSTIKILFGDTAGFALLRLIVFIGVPLVMAWRLWLQIKAQRRPDHLRKV